MRWILPIPLLLVASILALAPLEPLLRRPVSGPRLVIETFVTAITVIAAGWLGWVLLWWIEHRW